MFSAWRYLFLPVSEFEKDLDLMTSAFATTDALAPFITDHRKGEQASG
jgi:hypothetical protein